MESRPHTTTQLRGPRGTRSIVGTLFDQIYVSDIRFRIREAAVRQLILTHLRQKPSESLEAMGREVRRVYVGDLVIGQDLLEIEI